MSGVFSTDTTSRSKKCCKQDFDKLRHLWIHWEIAIFDVFNHHFS